MSDDPRSPPPAGPAQELRERWSLLAFAFLIMVASSGTWHSFSVFYVALLNDTGWDRSSTAGVFSVMILVYGATGVWFGALTDRLGARRVILVGAAILAAGLLLDTQVRAPWQLYLSHGVVVGIGQAGVGWIPFTVLIPRFFRQSLGVAIGIVSAGAGFGIATVVPLSQALIRWFGWRPAIAMLAGLAVAVAAPLTLVGLRGPYGDRAPRPETSPGPTRPQRGTTLGAALRDVRFWALTAGAALMSFGVQILTVHHVAALVDAGVAAMMAASTVGVMGLTSIPAKVGWGWLADRLGRPLAFGLGVLVFLAAVARLGTIDAGTSGAGVVAYGILIGLGYSMSATLTPVLTADLFHGVRYGAIFGTVNFLSQMGGAFGVWFAGFLHDLTGSYRLPLVLAAVAALVAAGVVIGPTARGRLRWQ
ncbi:MAG: MFS transporter [Candidatus Rokubacteria bacterium]|nr:MFS transporter [Candidatus Rokubacteria bacterium]